MNKEVSIKQDFAKPHIIQALFPVIKNLSIPTLKYLGIKLSHSAQYDPLLCVSEVGYFLQPFYLEIYIAA